MKYFGVWSTLYLVFGTIVVGRKVKKIPGTAQHPLDPGFPTPNICLLEFLLLIILGKSDLEASAVAFAVPFGSALQYLLTTFDITFPLQLSVTTIC